LDSEYAFTFSSPSKNLKIRTHKTVILPVLRFILREEHRLRVFEKGVLTDIFGPQREEATKDRRKV
jgi:hypothetical protein